MHADRLRWHPSTFPPHAESESYLHGPGSLKRWEALDAQFTPLIDERSPADQPWEVIVQAVRQDRPEPLDVFGAVLWVERGTVVASRDGGATAPEKLTTCYLTWRCS
jgi:hypothetical protein